MPDDKNYSPAFLKAVAFILPHEEQFARGHWGDERFVIPESASGDSGGWTKYGIDAGSHPGVDVKDLTRDQAIAIYADEWKWHDLDALPQKLAIALFDVWVNGGYAVKWLQIAINKVGFPCAQHLTFVNFTLPLTVDGSLGPKTVAAAQACDQGVVLRYFIQEREARFEAIAAANRQDRQFLPGWQQRDRDLADYLIS